MRTFRIVLWTVVAGAAGLLAYLSVDFALHGPAAERRANGLPAARVTPMPQVGGAFQAVRADGTAITRDDMLGRPHAIFFGFTNCPDVCPTTLYEASQWLQALGEEAGALDIYFVSVDPARDTPEVLASYLSPFDPRIVGITGSQAQIDDMAAKYRVFVERQGEGRDYNVNHTATTFLVDAQGRMFGTIAYGEDNETAIRKLTRLARSAAATS